MEAIGFKTFPVCIAYPLPSLLPPRSAPRHPFVVNLVFQSDGFKYHNHSSFVYKTVPKHYIADKFNILIKLINRVTAWSSQHDLNVHPLSQAMAPEHGCQEAFGPRAFYIQIFLAEAF